MQGSGFRVSGFGFRVSGFGFLVSGSGLGFRVSGLDERSSQTVTSKVSTGTSNFLYQARLRTVVYSKKDPHHHRDRLVLGDRELHLRV